VVPPITVKDLSQELGIRAGDILARLLMAKGVPLTINSFLDEDMVLTVAAEFSRDIEVRREQDVERDFLEKEGGEELASSVREEESPAGPDARSPVVVFMGHVDHGKTSLLDRIRESKVVDTEHGGITQHIRAYQVMTPRGGKVTFLDTPGHRAFTEMRARGANCTDIVVLVVAADDGVMPQTREAIDHARAANPDMPLVVALNKIDRPEADAMKVKQELMAMDLLPEEFGGKVGVIETSAQTGQGIDALLERLALEAEVRDLRADGTGRGRGYVIEASKQEGKGIHATILVRDGTLRVRDPFLCGDTWGRVRMMENDQGQSIKEAGPSMPVVVYGFKGDVPSAGDLFLAVQDERGAERVASERHIKTKEGTTQSRSSVTLENLFASLDAGKVHEICVVLKADVQGSVEVLERELDALQHSEVKVRVLRSAVGAVTEEDIMLANTSQAIVIGFGVIAEAKARRLQENLGVDLRHYNVIYELLDDLKKAMAGVLKPEETEKVIGHVEIREVFKVSRTGSIAGCFVLDGMIRRSDKVRVTREGKVIYTTTLESLRRFKDDVREVKEGFECGIKLTNFDDIKVSDIIEVFEIVFEERELSLS
jgi:translation initiation factor IF-2